MCRGFKLNLGKHSKMIIFESLVTTFEACGTLEAAGAVSNIGLSLKPNHRKQIKLVLVPDT